MDRACPETLPQPLRSPWYHFLSQSYNYFRYTSAILKISGGRKCRAKSTYTPMKTLPQNIGIATEIASISVSVAKLLVLPVLVTVSTSGLHQIVLSLVGQCRCWWRWIGRALKHYCSRWDLGIIFCRKVITTSGIGPPSWNFWGKEMSGKVDIHTSKNLTPKIGIDTEIASISVSVAKLLLFPVWGTVSTSGLYLMVFYVVWGCRRKCKGIGRARKLCRSRWDHVEMPTFTSPRYYYFRFVGRHLGFPTSGCIWQHLCLLKTDIRTTKLLCLT